MNTVQWGRYGSASYKWLVTASFPPAHCNVTAVGMIGAVSCGAPQLMTADARLHMHIRSRSSRTSAKWSTMERKWPAYLCSIDESLSSVVGLT